MLDKKGQSALEYLMTYGWALVVIVIVIAALVILVGGTPTVEGCSGSAKFSAPTLTDDATNLTIVITNNTAMRITNVRFTGDDITATTIPTWTQGDTNTVIIPWSTAPSGDYSTTLTITYTDPYSLDHVETLTCSGTI